MLEISGKSVFLDATKHPHRLAALIRFPDLDVRVIHLVRHPFGFASSLQKNESGDARRAARSWLTVNRRIESVLDRMGRDRWMRLRYEDLAADPEATLSRLHGFLAVSPEGVPPRDGVHHIVGNRMRLTSSPAGNIRLDQSWKDRLTPADQEILSQLTCSVATRYGYPPSGYPE
jgi:hypothetical protein